MTSGRNNLTWYGGMGHLEKFKMRISFSKQNHRFLTILICTIFDNKMHSAKCYNDRDNDKFIGLHC